MNTYETMHKLIQISQTFLISTIDVRGFPTTIVVSPPLQRDGIQMMTFYLNGNGESVENIIRDGKGSVCCYREKSYQSLSLKGKFSIRPFSEEDRALLNQYQLKLDHEEPVTVVFETMIAKVHAEGRTVNLVL
ncbi:hypothetical protein RU97_GL001167 [Enterococcus canis]|uniref:Pyridoxamine 5'-phosphate oxidase putative domain-containing protein n=1 Tax=Enterococcus canis TaxID=214095 RepID=A0A1L8RIL6_9ENTE|nr:pyridoxamine 5'-phosphate oxidase family protein [Enterococcus canis]OJG19596.1 hypothetical protein RU97_GL001167 [Enterococcus canis]